MKPINLYLENFFCYSKLDLNFNDFDSTLIIGNNATGKTTILKGMAFALFGKSDTNLEKIIKDNTDSCKVKFSFITNNNETFEIERARSRKSGTSEVKLRQLQPDGITWEDKTGRRSIDVEKEIEKIIKINYTTFINSVQFAQKDPGGLASLTPSYRKKMLKEILNIGIYSKLEELAKKEIVEVKNELKETLYKKDSLGNPQADILIINKNIDSLQLNLEAADNNILLNNLELEKLNSKKQSLQLAIVKTETINILSKNLTDTKAEQNKINQSIKETEKKLSEISAAGKLLINSIKTIKNNKAVLEDLILNDEDKNNLFLLKEQTENTLLEKSAEWQSLLSKYMELQTPLPDGTSCSHCRQEMSSEYRELCQKDIDEKLPLLKDRVKNAENSIIKLRKDLSDMQLKIRAFDTNEKLLKDLNNNIKNLTNEITAKKSLYSEYESLLEKHSLAKAEKEVVIEKLVKDIEDAKNDSTDNLILQLDALNIEIIKIKQIISAQTKTSQSLATEIGIFKSKLIDKEADCKKIIDLNATISKIEVNHRVLQQVSQAFGATGIPSLIIQTILDDLQIEANILLERFKPGLQLNFVVLKESEKGEEKDTLEIEYFINGNQREFEVLSGAEQLMVCLSIKLSLSKIVQRVIGTNIQFLLLDEADQSLDKNNVNCYAEIIKQLQADFKVFVITHNDGLKDKFTHAILVEQDEAKGSTAKLVTSW